VIYEEEKKFLPNQITS